MKRLKSIENKSEKQLQLIENKKQKQCINYKRLNLKRDKNLDFDFRGYKSLKEFFKEMYYWKLSIDRAEDIQKEFASVLTALEKQTKTWIYR